METKARLIPFYLPQFHPIPENDLWWGKGFTEWTNVARAKPLFRGHHQPKVPADLGFYDLRLPEAREAQAELARHYGIEGFCYYHYWFGDGRMLLERPFDEVLESGKPDFPFCLCWANGTWEGVWKGAPGKILLEQRYPGMEDHKKHFYWLLKAFTDKRYMTVDGKPILVIYEPGDIPDVRRVMDFWRELAHRSGLPGLHLIAYERDKDWNLAKHGFDVRVYDSLPPLRYWVSLHKHPIERIRNIYREKTGKPTIFPYERFVREFCAQPSLPSAIEYPNLVPNWDNTPRAGSEGRVLAGSTPELFRVAARKAVDLVASFPEDRRIVFVKSWNEWAEGNYLEPDLTFGHQYLQVLKEEVVRHRGVVSSPSTLRIDQQASLRHEP
jgi:hypothetical protein